jgi:hypothetical protein
VDGDGHRRITKGEMIEQANYSGKTDYIDVGNSKMSVFSVSSHHRDRWNSCLRLGFRFGVS